MRGLRISRRAVVTAIAATLALAGTGGADATVDSAYRYPVVAGTSAWRALKTHNDMVRVTQVPARTLSHLSTRALAATALDYPLFLDAVLFDDVQHGFDVVASRSTVLTALLDRGDVGAELVRRYRALDLTVPAGLGEGAVAERALAARKLELLLAQPKVLATLSPSALDGLIATGARVAALKRANVSVYGVAGLEPTVMMLGRAHTARFGTVWPSGSVVATGIAAGEKEIGDVLYRVISTRVPVEQPGVSDDYTGTVYTPRGSAVTVIWTTYELSSADISSFNAYVASTYPNATRETNASRRYNCHSYAWYNQSTSNTAWMNTPGDDKYWQDGSYRAYNSMFDGYPNGMKASYASDDHSGIEDYTRGYMWIRSKWGQGPRMYHYYNYSPYNSTTVNRYTNGPTVLP